MALVLLLANHVSVGPSLVDAVSDHRRGVYLSFFEPEKGSKREKTLTVESNPNISISDKYVHRLLCCMFSSDTASCDFPVCAKGPEFEELGFVQAKCTHR